MKVGKHKINFRFLEQNEGIAIPDPPYIFKCPI